MSAQSATTLITIWATVGPLAGVIVGALLTPFITNHWHRKQWILDNKRAEYRELLSVLCKSARRIGNSLPTPISVLDAEQQREIYEADVDARGVIDDRILIAERMRLEDIRSRWAVLMAERDFSKFWHDMDRLHFALVKMAHEDLGLNWKFMSDDELQTYIRTHSR